MSRIEVRTHRDRLVWGPFSDVGPADIDEVENTIGRALPVDYREFVSIANGGTLPYAVRLPAGDEAGELLEFSSLTQVQGDYGLAAGWARYGETVMAQTLPADLLPVAQDGGGSTLYVDLGEETYGSVWAFVFGLPEWTGRQPSTMGGRVASSWNAYLDVLTIDEEYARELWEEATADPFDDWSSAVVSWLDSGLPGWRQRPWASD